MKRIRSIFRANTFTPTGLSVWAGATALAFAVAHLAGWREQVTVLSGTLPPGSTFLAVQFRAAIYLAAYFGTVVGVPILLLAAGLLRVWLKVGERRDAPTTARTGQELRLATSEPTGK